MSLSFLIDCSVKTIRVRWKLTFPPVTLIVVAVRICVLWTKKMKCGFVRLNYVLMTTLGNFCVICEILQLLFWLYLSQFLSFFYEKKRFRKLELWSTTFANILNFCFYVLTFIQWGKVHFVFIFYFCNVCKNCNCEAVSCQILACNIASHSWMSPLLDIMCAIITTWNCAMLNLLLWRPCSPKICLQFACFSQSLREWCEANNEYFWTLLKLNTYMDV